MYHRSIASLVVFYHRYRIPLWFLGAGMLFGVGVVSPFGWVWALFGIAWYFRALREASTYRTLFWGSYIAWVLKYAVALLWFYTTYPLDWLGLTPGPYQYGLIALYHVPAALTLGTGGLLCALLYALQKKYCDAPKYHILLVPFFVLSEYFGALVFALYTYGVGGTIGSDFTFGFLGYTLAGHGALLSVAAVGGLTILSFALIAVGYCLYVLWMTKRYRLIAVLLGLLLMTSPVSLLPTYAPNTESRVVAMQMLWPRGTPAEFESLAAEKAAQLQMALVAASKLDPTHVVLPEDSRLTQGGDTTATKAYLRTLFPQATVIDSARVDNTAFGTVLRTYLYDMKADTVTEFDKQYLVPQGEYVPFVYQQLISMLPLSPDTKLSLYGTRYQRGIDSRTVAVPAGTPAILFCFESVTPWGVSRAAENRSAVPFVAHVVSHGWFQKTPYQLWHQLDHMLLVQAVSSGLPIVQSANAAPAKVYYPDGSIVYPPIQTVAPGVGITLIAL